MDIYYNGIGIIRGLTPEDMEEVFKHELEQKQKKDGVTESHRPYQNYSLYKTLPESTLPYRREPNSACFFVLNKNLFA